MESSKANVVPDRPVSGERKKVEKVDRKVDLKASTRLGQSVGSGARDGLKASKAWR
jgi:hypothetical protein